jgi:CMP-N-acetylneuraminic acid synthetase
MVENVYSSVSSFQVEEMRFVAIIPAKSNSSRVPSKNFREFYGRQSLLDIKIEQCKMAQVFDAIYVSSESDRAEAIAGQHDVEFVRRDERLCQDSTPWSEVLTGILDSVPVDDSTLIAWSPVTSPVFCRYRSALEFLRGSSGDSLMTVTKIQHYLLNADFLPLNFQFGVWASYSQGLKPVYQMNCALWLATKEKMLRNRFQTGDNPVFFELPVEEGIDIDTVEEFELAQYFYARRFVVGTRDSIV